MKFRKFFPYALKVKKPTAARPEGQKAHINSIALKAKKNTAARPERAKALSPGHRPGYNGNQRCAL